LKTAITAVVLFGLLGFAAYIGVSVWSGLGETRISAMGLVAMGTGVLFSLAIGGGLMYLVFWSSRHGHDDIDRDNRR
jgi:hypothetical protein